MDVRVEKKSVGVWSGNEMIRSVHNLNSLSIWETQNAVHDWGLIIVPGRLLCCTKTDTMLMTRKWTKMALPMRLPLLLQIRVFVLPSVHFVHSATGVECVTSPPFYSGTMKPQSWFSHWQLMSVCALHLGANTHIPQLYESIAGVTAGPQSIQQALHCRHSNTTQATVIVSSFDSCFDCAFQRGAAPSKPSEGKRFLSRTDEWVCTRLIFQQDRRGTGRGRISCCQVK